MPYLERSGARIHYEVQGAGPAVLLIQGVGAVGGAWALQVQGLADRCRLVWFDNRGIGESVPASGLSIEAMAGDALAVLDAVGEASAHVVGHSMGGIIAQQIALQAPERVRSLALLCTFASGRRIVQLSPSMAWIGLRTRLGTRGMRRRAFAELVTSAATRAGRDLDELAAELGAYLGYDLAAQPRIVHAQIAAARRHDIEDRLGSLAGLPTLVLAAAEDRIAPPAEGRILAQALGTELVLVEGAGHSVTLERPERVNALLAAHVAGATRGDPIGSGAISTAPSRP